MSDDPAVKRAVLREHGIEVPDKGRLSAENEAAYERLRQRPAGNYDGGVTAADFDDDAEDASYDDQGTEETTPRSVGGQRGNRQHAARLFGRVRDRAKADSGKKPRKARKRHPWVGTADVIEHFWSQLAWSARPIPPLQKILAAQAPTAGVVLQDALKGTIIDRGILQPVARFEDRAQAINAMAGPPIWTMMISMFGGAQIDPATNKPMLDGDGMYVFDNRTAPMVGGLRFSLMSWLKIASKSADEIMESANELTKLGEEADKLIQWILAPPEPGQSPKDMEKEARGKAMEFIGKAGGGNGATRPADSPGSGAPPARFASSAFDPKPAAGSSGGSG